MNKDQKLRSPKSRELLSQSMQETEDAMKEAKDIMTGKLSAKSYGSAQELFDELDAE